MKTFPLVSLISGVLLAPSSLVAAPSIAPNVLVIVADDMNDAVGALGNRTVKTPNIDKLMSMGVRFTNAHTNYPMSNPSRTSFLSGLYPDSTKVTSNSVNPRTYLGPDWVMMNEYFDNNGYFTARAGKVSFLTYNSEYRWDKTEPTGPTPPLDVAFRGGVGRWKWTAVNNKDEDLTDGANVNFIIRQLEEHRDGPFFIAMGFLRPHTPWTVPKKYFDLYPPSDIKLPIESGEPTNDRNDIPAQATQAYATEWADLKTDEERRQAIAAAYACHSFVDAGVGKLMDTLTRLDLWKNTTVIFFSDHGYNYGEHGGTVAKAMLFEDTTRVPLVIVSPGKATGKASANPVELVDLYPTLSELAGLPIPTQLEGRSVVPTLVAPDKQPSRAAYTIVRRHSLDSPIESWGRSIRTWRYRYTEWDPIPRGSGIGFQHPAAAELYDLTSDPNEYYNQVSNPDYASLVGSMKSRLQAARSRALLE